MDREELEGVASWAHGESGVGDGPVDAFDLVEMLDMPLLFEPGTGGRRARGAIYVGTSTPVRKLHATIAHECAHELLDRCALLNNEPNANYLGAALLAAYRRVDRQLRTGWNLHGLMAFHVNASAELLARRIVDVRGERAGIAIYDRGRRRKSIGFVHPLERALAAEALATGSPVRLDDLTGAWPVFVDGWRRVIVIAAA